MRMVADDAVVIDGRPGVDDHVVPECCLGLYHRPSHYDTSCPDCDRFMHSCARVHSRYPIYTICQHVAQASAHIVSPDGENDLRP